MTLLPLLLAVVFLSTWRSACSSISYPNISEVCKVLDSQAGVFRGQLVGWDEYELPLKFLHGRLVKCEQKSKYFVIILLRGGESGYANPPIHHDLLTISAVKISPLIQNPDKLIFITHKIQNPGPKNV